MFLLLITALFLFLYAVLIIYYWHYWKTLPVYQPSKKNDFRFISVIIPARNESGQIVDLLKALSAQDYPQACFEIIVVDDFSSDDTAAVVKNFALPHLQILQPTVPPERSSKKKAIETGIGQARGELIVTTDADCVPGNSWLSTLNQFYVEHDAAFIAAPVKFEGNGSWLSVFQSLDFLTLQGITAASVAANFHTMCNGANLAYKKQGFIDVNGFEGIDRVATGDDMLLMYKIWKRAPGKVFFLKNEKAIVTTTPMPDWKRFFMQRKRWASKTLVYDDYRIIAVLAGVYLLNCLFFVLLIAALFNAQHWWLVAAFLLVKTLIEFPFVNSVARFFSEQRLMKYFFFFQPLHIFYTVWVGLASQFGKYEWKGRKTK